MNQAPSIQVVTKSSIPLWRDERVLKGIVQAISAIAVIGFVVFFLSNVLQAAHDRGLSLEYLFLDKAAGMPLAESPIPYDEAKTFGYAFLVGLVNTFKAASVGIVLATALGTITALARLSTNWLISKIASAYIETIRNIPLLVQLVVWYAAVFKRLPPVKQSIRWPGPVYLSQRGLFLPSPVTTSTFDTWLIFAVTGLVLAIVLRVVLGRHQLRTGRTTYPVLTAVSVLLGFSLVGWFLVGESPLVTDVPVLEKFNFSGGMELTPEYAAVLVGLVVYTGAFIAEVVRAGILAVDRGQFEAARAVGLNQLQVLRLVVFPQAMRVITPPLISQYLNLTKNSSLAIIVGYPDLFFVGRTMINQAGRAVPVFVMVMAVYLFISLTTSIIMNDYNRYIMRKPTLLKRLTSVFRLDAKTFEELGYDPDATSQAAVLVVIVSLLGAIGASFGAGRNWLFKIPDLADLLQAIGDKIHIYATLGYGTSAGHFVNFFVVIFSVLLIWLFVSWFLWSGVTYLVGVLLFGGKTSLGRMHRVSGFVYAPQVLGIVLVISFAYASSTLSVALCLAGLVVWAWALIAGIIAVRRELNLDSIKAGITTVGTSIIGMLIWIVFYTQVALRLVEK